MPKNLKLIQLNIERSKHLAHLIPFLKRERPDIVCLQEVIQNDIPFLCKQLKMRAEFVPLARQKNDTDPAHRVTEGICILSPHPLRHTRRKFYYRASKNPPRYIENHDRKVNRALLWTTITKDGVRYTVGTTHFSWSPHGNTTPKQRKDLKALLKILDTIPDVVFCGDFNAPRGHEIFTILAEHFVDTIPKKYYQSLDRTMHRNKHITFMVDGLFCTLNYKVSRVKLIHGISDHVAVRAHITKK